MVSVTAGLSNQLLRLVYGAEAAALGGRSLELLALGLGSFAIFGVLTTVLNSLKRERSSALVTAVAVAAVAALCFLRVRGSEFGEGLLFRTASATSVGLLIATVGAGVLVRRAAGAVVAPLSVARVLFALTLTVIVGRWLPDHGKVITVLYSGLLVLGYLLLLVGTRELGRRDLAMIYSVVARRKR
jgi:stage V sporulation protein B